MSSTFLVLWWWLYGLRIKCFLVDNGIWNYLTFNIFNLGWNKMWSCQSKDHTRQAFYFWTQMKSCAKNRKDFLKMRPKLWIWKFLLGEIFPKMHLVWDPLHKTRNHFWFKFSSKARIPDQWTGTKKEIRWKIPYWSAVVTSWENPSLTKWPKMRSDFMSVLYQRKPLSTKANSILASFGSILTTWRTRIFWLICASCIPDFQPTLFLLGNELIPIGNPFSFLQFSNFTFEKKKIMKKLQKFVYVQATQ